MPVRPAVLMSSVQSRPRKGEQDKEKVSSRFCISTQILPKTPDLLNRMDSICRRQQVQRSALCHKLLHLFHTDVPPRTYKTSWFCQITLQILTFMLIPVVFNQCLTRRTTGFGLSFPSSVKYHILNEIAQTLQHNALRLTELALCTLPVGHFYFQGGWLLQLYYNY